MTWLRLIAALWRPLAALFAVLGLYGKGRLDQRRARKLDELGGYRDTREKMDAAHRHTDPDLARKRMRERGRQP